MIFTEKKLARVAAYCAKATPGPIEVHRFDERSGTISWQLQHADIGSILGEFADLDIGDPDASNPRARYDAEFHAKAVTDLPALVEYAREVRRVLRDRMTRLHYLRHYSSGGYAGSFDACEDEECVEVRRLLGDATKGEQP